MSHTVNQTLFFEHLRDSGGSLDMAVDGSSSPKVFEYSPGEGNAHVVMRLLLYIEDTAVNRGDRYGNVSVPAGKGFLMQRIVGGDVVQDLLDGVEVCNNNHVRSLSHDFDPVDWAGGGNKSGTSRWTFHRDGGKEEGLVLVGTDALRLTIRGDLQGLTAHYCKVRGRTRIHV